MTYVLVLVVVGCVLAGNMIDRHEMKKRRIMENHNLRARVQDRLSLLVHFRGGSGLELEGASTIRVVGPPSFLIVVDVGNKRPIGFYDDKNSMFRTELGRFCEDGLDELAAELVKQLKMRVVLR